MLFLVVSAFLAVIALLCFAWHWMLDARGDYNEWDIGGGIFSFLAVGSVVVGFIVSGIAWSCQVSDFENITKFQKLEVIYQAKAETLTNEFAGYLAKAYPEFEKDIYDEISPDKVGVYLVKYPELHTSETLVALVGNINELRSAVYNQQTSIEEARKNIRFRLRNPWYFRFMIPAE